MPHARTVPVSLRWQGDETGHLDILDQTRLPEHLEWRACRDVDSVVEAIKSLRVRGAPAIGIAGGYGLVVAAGEAVRAGLDAAAARTHVRTRGELLASARPTAVNLRWAVERCLALLDKLAADAPAAAICPSGRSTSSAGRSSIGMSSPLSSERSKLLEGAATKKGTSCAAASSARP